MKTFGLLVTTLFLLPGVANAQVTFGGGAGASGSTTAPPATSTSATAGASGAPAKGAAPAKRATGQEERDLLAESTGSESPEEREWAERDRKLNEGAVLTGGVGLLHTQHAQGGAPGQFRVNFTTEFMSDGFLCTSQYPCRDPRSTTGGTITKDTNDHVGGTLNLSVQVLKWLEAYGAISAYANSNDSNRPQLLQVLGDTTLGLKGHTGIGRVFHVGGAIDMWLVNGTGSVGLDGGGTSARFRGLGTADLRGLKKPLPLRFSLNGTYVLDNTGQVLADTERTRGTPVTRIERYGLNVNRVDHFDFHLGGEVFLAKERIRPFLEYNIAIPINRQGYLCRPNNPSSDGCLANDPVAPSSLTVGGRFFPWRGGFNLTAAVDIGVTGVGTFIEEVRPTPPWMVYLGAGWAFDTVERPQIVHERVVDRGGARGRKIRGFVHEDGKTEGVANAIVAWENHPDLTSLATGADGRFVTHELPDGPYTFAIRAEGYKPGTCTATVSKPAPKVPQADGDKAKAAPAPSAMPAGDIQLDCTLQALPRMGNIVGHVKDADTGAAIPHATVKVVDTGKKEFSGAADGSGSFRFEQLGLGDAQVTVDADGYLALTENVDIKAQKDNAADLLLKKRPKNSNVTVGKGEIVIKQQIQFAVDSATILPESNGLLSEIADAIIKNPRIHRIEVQGHTDNTGTADHNKQLSDDRANAVVTWLTSHGVAADRLAARGYGQTKPLVPNVTAQNRAKNRRVQFIIVDQDGGKGGSKP